MIIKIASGLLAVGLLASCANTQVTKQGTLEERMKQQAVAVNSVEPPPPAEGPEDVPADAPSDVRRNPSLVPSPLLRRSAASDTP